MKKWGRFLLFFLFLSLLLTSKAQAQFTYSTWTDSNTVTTSLDTLTASIPYQQITLYTDSVDVWIKWNNAKTFIRLFAGTPYSIGSSDKVSVIYVKTVTGTGVLYTVGLKTSVQSALGVF